MNDHSHQLAGDAQDTPTPSLPLGSSDADARGPAAKLPRRDSEVQGQRIPDGAGTGMQQEFGAEVDEEVVPSSTGVRCEDIGGVAGTGKTTLVKQRCADDPQWGKLCSTTGISAVNLDCATLNSTLRYFDTDSLRDNYLTGSLARTLHGIALEHRNLVIDEKSMLDGRQLDLIYRATQAANEYKDIKTPMGIILVGDFAQLPPVKAPWCFEAECWPEFEKNSTFLAKIWRQDQQEFLLALNQARSGNGARAAEILSEVGVRWETALDTDFDGTTIIPKNDAVDRYNQVRLDAHRGAKFTVSSRRWGLQSSEWKRIPYNLLLKEGCYVGLLSNSGLNEEGRFDWVNGDCGYVESYNNSDIAIRLVRTGCTVRVPRLVRSVTLKDKPDQWPSSDSREEGYLPHEHRDDRGKYVIGQVERFPVQLMYASTVHRSQGLSLDKVQIDFRNSFMAQPGMLYVSLSRCRTLEGLRLVGQRDRFGKTCNADPRVAHWL